MQIENKGGWHGKNGYLAVLILTLVAITVACLCMLTVACLCMLAQGCANIDAQVDDVCTTSVFGTEQGDAAVTIPGLDDAGVTLPPTLAGVFTISQTVEEDVSKDFKSLSDNNVKLKVHVNALSISPAAAIVGTVQAIYVSLVDVNGQEFFYTAQSKLVDKDGSVTIDVPKTAIDVKHLEAGPIKVNVTVTAGMPTMGEYAVKLCFGADVSTKVGL
jgi:hypothetical protein